MSMETLLMKTLEDRMSYLNNKKSIYVDNLIKWVEEEVNKKLVGSISEAKTRTWTVCVIKCSRTEWLKTRWRFSHEEMQGTEYWYQYSDDISGEFINVKEVVSEKLKELSKNLPFELTYNSERVGTRLSEVDPSITYTSWRYAVKATTK